MKTYLVGGAVRDALLGRPVKDRDYVVVGATPEEMIARGFKPVGKDFPVFLHPRTHEEYALARTERKTAPGYHGFAFYSAPDVTLEQDLARRDLTINAMARDEAGKLVDPFGGESDLKAGVLRHVSAAFAEDPVRILRVARFAARYGFTVARDTIRLMKQMVKDGEADALVAERVWQEFASGLMEAAPMGMFDVLRACGALARIAPELDVLLEDRDAREATRVALEAAAQAGAELEIRFAVLTRALDPLAVESLCSRLRVPAASRDLALLASRHANTIVDARELDAPAILDLLDATDAWRRPERFRDLAAAALAAEPEAQAAQALLERVLRAAGDIDAGAIAKAASSAPAIRVNIGAARLAAVEAALR